MAERATRPAHTTDIHEEVIRALLANAPAVMDIAVQLDLTPREVRNILQETLLQFGEPQPQASDVIPITAHSAGFPQMSLDELHQLLGGGQKQG